MGGAPTVPTAQGPLPGDFSGYRWPPKWPPDGDYKKNGERGMTPGDPEIAVQARNEPPCNSGNQVKIVPGQENQPILVIDADIRVEGIQFPLTDVDGGATSGWTGGGTSKIESPIFGFDAAAKSGPAAGRKLRGIFDGGGRTSVYGGVKSGPAVEGNVRLHLFTPKVKIADERNQELQGANRGLGWL